MNHHRTLNTALLNLKKTCNADLLTPIFSGVLTSFNFPSPTPFSFLPWLPCANPSYLLPSAQTPNRFGPFLPGLLLPHPSLCLHLFSSKTFSAGGTFYTSVSFITFSCPAPLLYGTFALTVDISNPTVSVCGSSAFLRNGQCLPFWEG